MLIRRVRNYFLAGILVTVPIGVTVWIVWSLFNLLDSWFRKLLVYYDLVEPLRTSGYFIPQHGVGFLMTIGLIVLVGFGTQLYIGRKVFDLVDLIFLRIPVISSIYRGLKQVVEALMGRRKNIFERAVLIEYPRKGLYSIAFVTGKDQGLISPLTKEPMIYVFMPTTPNPTSGFYLIVPKSDCISLDLGVEDAMKMIISSGMVVPETPILPQEILTGKAEGAIPYSKEESTPYSSGK